MRRLSAKNWIWIGLPVGLLMAITLPPFIYAVRLSLLNFDISKPYLKTVFVGFDNYVEVLLNTRSLNAFRKTGMLVGLSVSVEIIMGIGIALLINRFSSLRTLLYTLVLVPLLLPRIVVALLWKIMYHPTFGIINYVVGLFNLPTIAWLANPKLALYSIAIVDIWQWTPFVTLIISSALEVFPKDPIEAAQIEGANRTQIFSYILLPMLKPVLVVAVIFRTLMALRTFDLVWIMTGGGPGISTETVDIYVYLIGLSRGGRISYASATAIIMLGLTIGIFTFFLRTAKK